MSNIIYFKDVLGKIQRIEPEAEANVIKDLINDCLDEISLELFSVGTIELNAASSVVDLEDLSRTTTTYQFSDAFSSAFGASETFDISVVTVNEVYVNGDKYNPSMTRKDYEEETYSASDFYCHVSKERKIYFPEELSASDDVEIVAHILNRNIDSLDGKTQIYIPRTQLPLLVNYVLKELYLLNDFENYEKHTLYKRRYDYKTRQLKGNPIDTPLMNLGTKL